MKNKLLMTSMSTIIGLYGVAFLFLLLVFQVFKLDVQYLLFYSILFLILQFLLAPYITDWVMKVLYKADFKAEMPEFLKTFVTEVCNEHHMKYPKIGYINDGAPNAFTYGRTKNDARIVLTRGIFDLLTPDEVKAVMAHELGHAIHYDMFFMTVAQIIPLVLRWVYEVTLRAASRSRDNKGAAMIGAVAYILHIIAQYVVLWFSRTREYYADEFAVEKTKNPFALSNALVKIGYGLAAHKEEPQSEIPQGKEKPVKKVDISSVSALGIFDSKTSKTLIASSFNDGKLELNGIKKAARWELWNPWATWYELHSTHPRISKRLKAISKMADTYGQTPYISFDEHPPESYFDDFIIEILIHFLPTVVVISCLFLFLAPDIHIYSILGVGALLLAFAHFFQLQRAYKNRDYIETKVADLLGEVKVSKVTSIPCILKGRFIGRGTPGYIFSEDFVIQDETGIMFIDYKQPLSIMNFIFGAFKAKQYINKDVVVKGWYKRAPIPYLELYKMQVDNEEKTCYTYGYKKLMIGLLLVISVVLLMLGFGI